MTDNSKSDTYSPVDLDFIELVKARKESGKVHYFDGENNIEDAVGLFTYDKNDQGEFITNERQAIRLDKIITFLGKPGPAYEVYESYANACLTCEDLGQF